MIIIKKLFIYTLAIAFIAVIATADSTYAKPDFLQETEVVNSNGHAVVSIPEHARQVSPGVFSLGSQVYGDKIVDGYVFVDYVEAHKKPDWAGGGNGKNGGNETSSESCYTYFAKNAKWKSVESWVMNPANTADLDENFVFSNMKKNIVKWENAASFNILGEGSLTNDSLEADFETLDETNEVYFADITNPGVIGVTVVWGVFGGPPQGREIISWDQVYNDFDYDWSEDCDLEDCTSEGSQKMDFEDISTHELGHSVGLGDLYDSSCSTMTMFGYADYGDTNSRTLEDGDINGIFKLYN